MSLSPLWILGLKWTVLDQMYHTCQWPETVKPLDDNKRVMFHGTVLGSNCLDMPLKAQETKVKTDKWDGIKFKKFCTAKEII